MPRASRFFTRVTVVVSLLAAANFLAPASGPTAGAAATDPLEPDLRTRRPNNLVLQRDSGEASGADIIRFSNEILNRGLGPMEMRPEGDCDGDGEGENDDDRMAYQRVFQDTNDNDVFDRYGTDKDTALEREAGCTHFHPAHNHWHFDDFALYELLPYTAEGGLGERVAWSEKIGFCLVDTTQPKPNLPSSPKLQFYRGGCLADDPTGISVGWADTYGYNLPHQWVDVTGVPNGRYCLRSTADPSNVLVESKDFNNSRSIKVRLRTNRVDYKPRRGCR